MKELLTLFFAFCRIGGLTFGGGMAMLPMLQKEVVEKYKWATEEELSDYYAIGQCTPGIIAVNTATFIGYKCKGIIGALFATYGVVTPSWIIILLIAAFISNFTELSIVQDAFSGIQVCVCVLILNAVLKLGKKTVVDLASACIFIAVMLFSFFTNLSPVIFVILSGAAGVIIQVRRRKKA